MGLVPICRLSNVFNPSSLLSLSPCLCPGLSADAAAQTHQNRGHRSSVWEVFVLVQPRRDREMPIPVTASA